MSSEGINLTGRCQKCGGHRWEYHDYDRHEREEIRELRCLNPQCGHQDLIYGSERYFPRKTPDEVKQFIEDYDLEEQLLDLETSTSKSAV